MVQSQRSGTPPAPRRPALLLSSRQQDDFGTVGQDMEFKHSDERQMLVDTLARYLQNEYRLSARNAPTTFYRWYDRFVEHGPEGLEDRPSSPSRVWNRIPDAVRAQIVTLALDEPELSPRELAVKFADV